MRCPPELGVKQFVAEMRSSTGTRFRVYTTGSDRHYIFDPIERYGCSYCQGFPVLKARLRPELRRTLAHGWGIPGVVSTRCPAFLSARALQVLENLSWPFSH